MKNVKRAFRVASRATFTMLMSLAAIAAFAVLLYGVGHVVTNYLNPWAALILLVLFYAVLLVGLIWKHVSEAWAAEKEKEERDDRSMIDNSKL